MKWLSFSGVSKEAKRIRWPKGAELREGTSKVLFFVILFGLFFVTTEFLITFFLRLIGIGA